MNIWNAVQNYIFLLELVTNIEISWTKNDVLGYLFLVGDTLRHNSFFDHSFDT